MITDNSSILRNLPKNIGDRERLIFDSLGFTLEMIDINYDNLIKQLESVSEVNSSTKNAPKTFLDCWGIIDNTKRFISIYKLLSSESSCKILEPIKIVWEFRNTFQHLDERIDDVLLKNERPFYGSLKWCHLDKSNQTIASYVFISGVILTLNETIPVPTSNNLDSSISEIILESVGRNKRIEVNISELINNLKIIVDKVETNLQDQFKNNGSIPLDWRSRRDIMLISKREKNTP